MKWILLHGSANLQDEIWGIEQVAAVLPVHLVFEAKVQEAELIYMERYYSLDNTYVASLAWYHIQGYCMIFT